MRNPNVIVSSKYGPIIINRYDNGVGKQISQLGYFSDSDVDLIKNLVAIRLQNQETVTFYDIGANVGTHTLALAKSFPENIKIRAFEAQRQVYYMLCGTVAINGLENVSCHLNAVADTNGAEIAVPIPNYHAPQNFGGLEVVAPQRSDNQDMRFSHIENVSTVTIDSFCEQVDFLKMDIEGMEDKALFGATATVQKYRPISFVEILKTDIDFCLKFFSQHSYRVYERGMDIIAIPTEHQIDFSDLKRLL